MIDLKYFCILIGLCCSSCVSLNATPTAIEPKSVLDAKWLEYQSNSNADSNVLSYFSGGCIKAVLALRRVASDFELSKSREPLFKEDHPLKGKYYMGPVSCVHSPTHYKISISLASSQHEKVITIPDGEVSAIIDQNFKVVIWNNFGNW